MSRLRKGAALSVVVSDVAFDETGALTVDLEVLCTDFEVDIAAIATYPLDEVTADACVPQDFISVAPDGRLLAMKPTRERHNVFLGGPQERNAAISSSHWPRVRSMACLTRRIPQ